MYIAKLPKGSTSYYQIRTSFKKDHGTYRHKILFELGEDPADYFSIEYDHVVIFSEELLAPLTTYLGKDPEPYLESLLFTFFPKNVQERLQNFKGRTADYKGRLTKEEQQAITKEVHIFDRRRLYYLRYGAVDQSRLTKLHEKCCRPLLQQSRDEREYYFSAEEKVLEPGSYYQYIYAIFNLQKHFTQSFAPWLPEALAKKEIADQLIETICALQSDPSFWQQETPDRFLHRHLARYLWMFFDFTPHTPSYQREFVRAFMGSHRSFSWPKTKGEASPEQIEEIFGIPKSELEVMPQKDLTRLYRQKALELHPDKGGDAEEFIILTEIYTTFSERKK